MHGNEADLLVGRDDELRSLRRRLTAGGAHPTIEGPSGVGKTSLAEVATFQAYQAFEAGAAPPLLMLDEIISVGAEETVETLRRRIDFALVRGFRTHRTALRARGFTVPSAKELRAVENWFVAPESTQVSGAVGIGPIGSVGLGRGSVPTSSPGFQSSGLRALLAGWLVRCFPTSQAGGFVVVVDNLELLGDAGRLRSLLESLRDPLLTSLGLKWIFCGVTGIREALGSARVSAHLSSPIRLTPLPPDVVTEVTSRRIVHYRINEDAYAPVDGAGFALVYSVLHHNLRDALATCQDFALFVDEAGERPDGPEVRIRVLGEWLRGQAEETRMIAAASGVREGGWIALDVLAGRPDGRCTSREYGLFNSPSYRVASPGALGQRMAPLVKANLVDRSTEEESIGYSMTTAGWKAHYARVGIPGSAETLR